MLNSRKTLLTPDFSGRCVIPFLFSRRQQCHQLSRESRPISGGGSIALRFESQFLSRLVSEKAEVRRQRLDISNRTTRVLAAATVANCSAKNTTYSPMFHPAPFARARSNPITSTSYWHSAAAAAGNTHVVKSGQVAVIPPTGADRQTDRLWAFMCSVAGGLRRSHCKREAQGG